MSGLCPEDENSTCQTRWVTYDFYSPSSFDTHIGETGWALKENPEGMNQNEEIG